MAVWRVAKLPIALPSFFSFVQLTKERPQKKKSRGRDVWWDEGRSDLGVGVIMSSIYPRDLGLFALGR